MPAGILRRNSRRDLLDAIARASPMDEVGSTRLRASQVAALTVHWTVIQYRSRSINRTHFIHKIERAVNCRLRCRWNYVGRHGADGTHSLSLVDCPVDSRATVQCLRSLDRDGCSCWQPVDCCNSLGRDNNSLCERAGAECFRCLFRDDRSCFAIRSAEKETT